MQCCAVLLTLPEAVNQPCCAVLLTLPEAVNQPMLCCIILVVTHFSTECVDYLSTIGDDGILFVVVDQQRHNYHSSMGTTVKRILEVQLGLQSRNFHAGPDRGCTSINEAENSIPRRGSVGLSPQC